MDKILTRIAILIAIIFMLAIIIGVGWLFLQEAASDIMQVTCPRCGIEFHMEIGDG